MQAHLPFADGMRSQLGIVKFCPAQQPIRPLRYAGRQAELTDIDSASGAICQGGPHCGAQADCCLVCQGGPLVSRETGYALLLAWRCSHARWPHARLTMMPGTSFDKILTVHDVGRVEVRVNVLKTWEKYQSHLQRLLPDEIYARELW